MREIAGELGCELLKLEDGVKRGGPAGWLVSGLHAVARKIPPVQEITASIIMMILNPEEITSCLSKKD